MGLATILRIIASCFICNSNSSCGNRREYSDSVKKRKKNNDMKLDEDDLYML